MLDRIGTGFLIAIFNMCSGIGGVFIMIMAALGADAMRKLEVTDYLLAFFIPFYGIVKAIII